MEMLTSALRALVKNLIKEIFYGKRKIINVLTAFFISLLCQNFYKMDY